MKPRPPLSPRTAADQAALDNLDAELAILRDLFVSGNYSDGQLSRMSTIIAELDRLRPSGPILIPPAPSRAIGRGGE